MKHSYPTLEPMKFLLEMIHNRAMALPDFQRDFVWDPSATDELIESIISNYPAGTLLRIKNGQQLLFQPRAFAGAPELNGEKPAYLILDGQQRLDERNVSPSLRDCILNRTFIDRSTNHRLSRRSPSDYFGEIRSKQGENETDVMLKSHLLPDGSNSPLLEDNFEGLLAWRENALKALINSKTA